MSVRPEGFFQLLRGGGTGHVRSSVLPLRGISLEAAYSLYTDNLATYDGGSPFSALSVRFCPVVSLSDRLKLLPSAFGRVLIGHDPAYSYFNNLGERSSDVTTRNRCLSWELTTWRYSRMP